MFAYTLSKLLTTPLYTKASILLCCGLMLVACGGGGDNEVPANNSSANQAPTNVELATVQASSSNVIEMAWALAKDDKTTASSLTYQVHLSESANFSPSSTTLRFSQKGAAALRLTRLKAATIYYLKLVVVDDDGAQTISAEKVVTTPSLNMPPTNVELATVQASSSNVIEMAWALAKDDKTTASSLTYQVHLSESANFSPSSTTLRFSQKGAAALRLTRLKAATIYYLKLVVVDDDGAQTISAEKVVTTPSLNVTNQYSPKIILFGDSRTEQNSISPLSPQRMTRFSDYGYVAWAQFFSRGNFEIIYNAGIGGNTTAQMLSRFNTDVSPYLPDELWGEGGINDFAVTEADTKANLAAIFDLAEANGIYVRWSTISPLETGHKTFNAHNVARISNINKWLREQALTRKNFALIDSFSAMIDPLSITGSAKSGMMQTDDHIHQSPKGARFQGKAFADSFLKDHDLIDYLPQFAGDRYSLSTSSKQLFDNPFFTSSGGKNYSSGVVTGTIPANSHVSVSGTWGAGLITSALVARADGFGYDWVLTVTNAGAENDELSITTDELASSISNSDVLYAAAEVSMSGLLKNRGFQLEIRSIVNSVFSSVSTLEYAATQPVATDAWTDVMYNQDNVTGVMKTPKLTLGDTGSVTSCYARLKFRFGGVGSTATIKIGRLAVYKN